MEAGKLGDLIRSRRKALGLSAAEAARRAGIARNTWRWAEEGSRRTKDHLHAGIERALQWQSGSIDAILAGGEPTPVGIDDDEAPAGDRAVVLQVVEILQTRYSPAVKLQMIEDVISRDFEFAQDVPEDDRLASNG